MPIKTKTEDWCWRWCWDWRRYDEQSYCIIEAGVDIIAVDSAHGHSKGVLDKITEIRNAFPKFRYCRRKHCYADATEALIKAVQMF